MDGLKIYNAFHLFATGIANSLRYTLIAVHTESVSSSNVVYWRNSKDWY